MEALAFSLTAQEAEAGGIFVTSRPAWSITANSRTARTITLYFLLEHVIIQTVFLAFGTTVN